MKNKTTCPYCGVGCGVVADVQNNHVASVAGDTSHPANSGKLCVKGSSLDKVLGATGRLTQPKVNGVTTDWDNALNEVAGQLLRTMMMHGPDAIAFYLSGQLLTEDYYVANKLMKGFIGSANVDTNSRLCMSSAVVGYKRAFGADAVPCNYEDLERTDLLVLVGSNAAWNHPILFQRMRHAKAQRPEMRIVVIDPRRTATCDIADLHLAIQPGTDVLLFTGLLAYLAKHDALDESFIKQHTEQFDAALNIANDTAAHLPSVAQTCGVELAALEQFYQLFLTHHKVVSFYSQGVNQSSQGSNNANAIINCHLATGRLGYAGAGPFSITGQPNAMGGREVGGLANQLAAHMEFNEQDVDRVGRFWGAYNMATQEGLKAVDMFDAVASGKIKAIWIMGTNPAVSLPKSDAICAALKQCPLVIVSDCIANTDTQDYADICLPATGWSEKDGTVTNAERRISRQRALLPPLGEAKPDWWIISSVAKRMGFSHAFDYKNPRQIFTEHAALSGFENHGQRCFNISQLAHLNDHEYEHLTPIQWPVTSTSPTGTARLFTDHRYFTPSHKARFIPTSQHAAVQQPTSELPYIVNTGRIRDQWHTMAITGRAEGLFQHRSEPFIEIATQDAIKEQIKTGDLIELRHPQGVYIARAQVSDDQRAGELFAPIHWNRQFASQGNISNLIEPVVDPYSGQPESKHGRAALKPFTAQWQGLLMVRSGCKYQPTTGYWARVPKAAANQYYLADQQPLDATIAALSAQVSPATSVIESSDNDIYRAAAVKNGQLEWLLAVLPYDQIPPTDWLAEQFAKPQLTHEEEQWLLSLSGGSQDDSGAIICSCFQVGANAIKSSIEAGCKDLDSLTAQLKCGSNCGSCIPELNQLIAAG
ncbi:nitrate reductase [Neptunomonas marina]|uniref:Nitrate reductase n=1 Tax=Neptunomonas marina TaxID=1815562 RepID=A0A437Q9Z1_9GAMM|nr:nitrate reductase [Neptunomonas marina]RVU31335.1 nitrate reductase [Neptunomonas marina]